MSNDRLIRARALFAVLAFVLQAPAGWSQACGGSPAYVIMQDIAGQNGGGLSYIP